MARRLVRGAALLVPHRIRAGWLREWEVELWHELQRRAALGDEEVWEGRGALWVVALGAWPDALAVRRLSGRVPDGRARKRSTGEALIFMIQQLRVALRGPVRSGGFSVMAVLILGLGLGATAAIYTVVDAVVLRPLGYPAADRLVVVGHHVPGLGTQDLWPLSQAGYFYFLRNNRSFADLGVYLEDAFNLSGEGSPERVHGAVVTASLLRVLGARVVAGRLFRDEENLPGATRVVLLGYAFWQRRFGGDPDMVGSTVRIDGRPLEVVGILAPGVELPDRAVDIWLSVQLYPDAPAVNSHYLPALARLAPGVSVAAARTDMARLNARLPEALPAAYSPAFMEKAQFTTTVEPLRTHLVGGAARALWILLGCVGLVLLVACFNVAHLFLVRAEGRGREVAVRRALGAAGSDLWRLFAMESLLLTGMAGLLGLGLAWAGVRLLVTLAPAGLPRVADIRLHGTTILLTMSLAVLAGLAFAALSGLRRPGSTALALRESERGRHGGPSRSWARGALVVGQVAIALVLLLAAALMVRSYQGLRRVQPGFQPRGAVTFEVSLPYNPYHDARRASAFFSAVLGRIRQLPGVTAAGGINRLPIEGGQGCYALFVEGRELAPGEPAPCIRTRVVSPGYFAAMGIRVRGRGIQATDIAGRMPVAMVSPSLAERLWPGQDALGQGVRPYGSRGTYYRVVGVTEATRDVGLDQPPGEDVYYPLVGTPGDDDWIPTTFMNIVVRTTRTHPTTLGPELRRAVAAVDPDIPIGDLRTLETVVAHSMMRVSFAALLIALAAGMVLLLGSVGLYGGVAYVVARRRTEIGIRMALGARRAQVVGLVVGRSFRFTLVGIAVGLALALATTRILRSFLFEVSPTDPLTFVVVPPFLAGVALLAAWVPARRAARVDPVETLREE